MIYNRRDNVAIRIMDESDIDTVMRIWLESNIKTHYFIPASYWKGQYEEVKLLIADAEIYVCEKADKIVGFIGLIENYIAGIFVDSAFNHRDWGKSSWTM